MPTFAYLVRGTLTNLQTTKYKPASIQRECMHECSSVCIFETGLQEIAGCQSQNAKMKFETQVNQFRPNLGDFI